MLNLSTNSLVFAFNMNCAQIQNLFFLQRSDLNYISFLIKSNLILADQESFLQFKNSIQINQEKKNDNI